MKDPLRGVVVPLVTPFDASLKVDLGALRDLCEFLVASGAVDALLLAGTTGEFLALDHDERASLTETVVGVVGGRVPVVVHAGSYSPGTTVELALHALRSGAAGVAVVTPYYFRVDQGEIEGYYSRICSSLPEDFPVYLYNIPALTGNSIEPQTVERLALRFPNIVGLKFSSPDLVTVQDYVRLRGSGGRPLACLVGCDEVVLPSIVAGARGAVSGHGNALPDLLRRLVTAATEQRLEEARRLQATLTRVSAAFGRGNVARIKGYLGLKGFGGMRVRPPLMDIPPEDLRTMAATVDEAVAQAQSTVDDPSHSSHPGHSRQQGVA